MSIPTGNAGAANHQWRTRPDDERFTSLTALHAYCQNEREHSAAKIVSSRALTVSPVAGDNEGLTVAGPGGNPVSLTNWAFGQLAARAKAPAGYMRELPAPLAADCLNYGLHFSRDVEDIGVLLTRNGEATTARAFTGPSYGRIWNSNITRTLVEEFGDGVTGRFRVPGEMGAQNKEVTKESTTLYASDRDMWIFLADESNRYTLPDRRGGRSGDLSVGFFIGNSDTGSKKLMFGQFAFDFMCSNHLIWGMKDYEELSFRHTAGAPDKWRERVIPALKALATREHGSGIIDTIKAARAAKLEDVTAFLLKRFNKSQVPGIVGAFEGDEARPMESVWDVATGVTAYARGFTHTDERVKLEREAGKILQLA